MFKKLIQKCFYKKPKESHKTIKLVATRIRNKKKETIFCLLRKRIICFCLLLSSFLFLCSQHLSPPHIFIQNEKNSQNCNFVSYSPKKVKSDSSFSCLWFVLLNGCQLFLSLLVDQFSCLLIGYARLANRNKIEIFEFLNFLIGLKIKTLNFENK